MWLLKGLRLLGLPFDPSKEQQTEQRGLKHKHNSLGSLQQAMARRERANETFDEEEVFDWFLPARARAAPARTPGRPPHHPPPQPPPPAPSPQPPQSCIFESRAGARAGAVFS